jgi:hypothetical protein
VLDRKSSRPTSPGSEREPRGKDLAQIDPNATPKILFRQDGAIRAEIVGEHQCEAEGLSARGPSPVLALCRLLIRAGFDPARPLLALRGHVHCLEVRSIGEGAKLTIKERPFGPVFESWAPFPTPPVAAPISNPETGATPIARRDTP